MMKNALYFILKSALTRNKVNFEIYDVTDGQQRITANILLNISRIKGNQTIKFGQLIEHPKRNIFKKNYAEHETGKLVPDRFLFFKKVYIG